MMETGSAKISGGKPPKMNSTATGDILQRPTRIDQAVNPPSEPAPRPERLRIDGKFFSRGGQRVRVRGVTYGPFAPHANDEPFPCPEQVAHDFAMMHAAEINSIRIYHFPPDWLLALADQEEIGVLIDVPWAKHLCFLDNAATQAEARQAVRDAASRGCRHAAILAYSLANEIPANVVRWHGARRVERFLAELRDVAKQADPGGLVTYANFPSTEYLDLSFLDFATFNVYLHDLEAFRRYLLRLQNIVGDRPLLLGELGMDTIRHGEAEQAGFLAGHVREAALAGVAGTFVFSWTDDWHTGGQPVEDWAFGITDARRAPKASYHELGSVFQKSPAALLEEAPRVSVVVCSYNGGRTLDQCIRSLLALNYANYEVIVVDDGSTDDTQPILSGFSTIQAIRQENQGLSVARNVGMEAATGEIVAYTDADCFADPDWLTHLVFQFQRSTAAAVGGPNLAPDDGWLAACVAAAPGQPMHVLVSDQEAEHIPGCNMAFLKDALLAIKGFDPLFRKAGDDVDVCWRLQQAGYWITFAPGAFVWHHRRPNIRAFFRQQAGYGEAEALLRFKHPDRFNSRGDGKWNGALYGASLPGLRVAQSIIYRGVFGSGLFQCLYQPAPAHWAVLPSTLEWHAAAALAAAAAIVWPVAGVAAAAMLALSLLVASIQAAGARVAPQHDGWQARLLVVWICYGQPLVRSWRRYQTRLFSYRAPIAIPVSTGRRTRLSLLGKRTVAYWSETGVERLQLLGRVILYLNENRWGKTLDSGWDDWDLEMYCHPWTVVQVSTADENHGNNRFMIRVRYRLRPSGYWKLLAFTGTIAAGVAAATWSWPAAAVAAACGAACAGLWWLGTSRASHALAVFDRWADECGLHRCTPAEPRHAEIAAAGKRPALIRRLFGRLARLFSSADGAPNDSQPAGDPTVLESGRPG
jgi:O-antigen biosynthesis protein